MTLFHNRQFSSLTYLNITQFLGALNDNLYKFLIVFFLIDVQGIENSPIILSLTGAIFVIPFLFFSASSGVLADRFSKRNIIVLTKILELVITAFGILIFAFQSPFGAYSILFLLATQSAIFGPSKYGIIPELVSSEKISEANGLLTSFTFLAIIFGTFLANFLTDWTERNFVIASMIGTLISVIGVITSFCIEYTPPAGSSKRFNILFLKEIISTLKFSAQFPSLLAAIFGSAFFLFLGSFLQLNLIPYAVDSLHLKDVGGGYLFLITALGIGCGSFFAGKISGKTAELGLVPLAGVAVAICCFLLDVFSTNLFAVVPLVVLSGMFGGMYEIPMDSYVQIASPNEHRGQVIATTNFISFFGVLLAAGVLYLNTEILGLSPARGFTVVGFITVIVVTIVSFQFFDYLIRFVGMLLSRLFFRITFYGQDNIPATPAIYVCTLTAWNDTLLLFGTQRRRMRFFLKEEYKHSSKWQKQFYKVLKAAPVPSIEPLENNPPCVSEIKKTLKKGISVCIFTDHHNVFDVVENLKQSELFHWVVEENEYPIIPIMIERGQKEKQPRFFSRLYNLFRVPTSMVIGLGSIPTPLEKDIDPDFLPDSC